MELEQVVLTFHVLGAGVLVGAVLTSVLAISRQDFSGATLKAFGVIKDLIPKAVIVQVLTGAYLLYLEWDELAMDYVFWAKMGLFIVSGILANGVLNKRVAEAKSEDEAVKAFRDTYGLRVIDLLILITVAALGAYIAHSSHHG